MKTKEMIGYLLRFDPETEVSVMVVNPPGRIKHAVEGVICITDCERPFFGIEVGGGIPFSQEEVRAAEEDEAYEEDFRRG